MNLRHPFEIKMRISLVILILLGNVPSVQTTDKKDIQVAKPAFSLFQTIIDLFENSTQDNELEQLTRDVSELKDLLIEALKILFKKLDEISYRSVLSLYIDKIDSCRTDYLYYVADPSPTTESNLKKCSDIIYSVRPLGKYLSGGKIYDGPLLFDLYKDSNGVCDGPSMENIFKTLFAEYVIGCNVAITIEGIEHGKNVSLFATECKNTMSKVVDYLKVLYHSCALPFCKTFHCSVQHIFSKSPPRSPNDLHIKLSEIHPWFNFLIFRSSKRGQTTFNGNFFVRHDDNHWTSKTTYDIFYFDGFTQLTKEKQNFRLAIQVTKRLLIDQYFGNSAMEENFWGFEIGTFVGYAPENNSICNDKYTEDDRNCHTTGSSNIISAGPYLIFYLFVVLGALVG